MRYSLLLGIAALLAGCGTTHLPSPAGPVLSHDCIPQIPKPDPYEQWLFEDIVVKAIDIFARANDLEATPEDRRTQLVRLRDLRVDIGMWNDMHQERVKSPATRPGEPRSEMGRTVIEPLLEIDVYTAAPSPHASVGGALLGHNAKLRGYEGARVAVIRETIDGRPYSGIEIFIGRVGAQGDSGVLRCLYHDEGGLDGELRFTCAVPTEVRVHGSGQGGVLLLPDTGEYAVASHAVFLPGTYRVRTIGRTDTPDILIPHTPAASRPSP